MASLETTNSLHNQQLSSGAETQAGPHVVYLHPAPTPPVFNGSPEQWHIWWSLFKALVHDSTYLSDVHKFMSLLNSLMGKARDIIGEPIYSPQAYGRAIQKLKKAYCNPCRDKIRYKRRFEQITPPQDMEEDLLRFIRHWENAQDEYKAIVGTPLHLDTQDDIFRPKLPKATLLAAFKFKGTCDIPLDELVVTLERIAELNVNAGLYQVAQAPTPAQRPEHYSTGQPSQRRKSLAPSASRAGSLPCNPLYPRLGNAPPQQLHSWAPTQSACFSIPMPPTDAKLSPSKVGPTAPVPLSTPQVASTGVTKSASVTATLAPVSTSVHPPVLPTLVRPPSGVGLPTPAPHSVPLEVPSHPRRTPEPHLPCSNVKPLSSTNVNTISSSRSFSGHPLPSKLNQDSPQSPSLNHKVYSRPVSPAKVHHNHTSDTDLPQVSSLPYKLPLTSAPDPKYALSLLLRPASVSKPQTPSRGLLPTPSKGLLPTPSNSLIPTESSTLLDKVQHRRRDCNLTPSGRIVSGGGGRPHRSIRTKG